MANIEKSVALAAVGGVAVGALAASLILGQNNTDDSDIAQISNVVATNAISPMTPSKKNLQESRNANPYMVKRDERIKNQKPITYIVVGAGNRGSIYAIYAGENPSLATIVGVAEPRKYHRESFVKKYGSTIPAENVWEDWQEIVKRDKLADAVVITTPDILHVGPAIALANKGYHILLEKPMAIAEEDCGCIAKAVQDNNLILAVGHVMRYTPYTQKIKEIVDSGKIGKVMSINHVEPVGWFHFAHSYVRGNWRREDQATFSLMAKSCHDIDWIRYIMGAPCTRVTSFGSLSYFTKENKPKEAGDAKRCLDCPMKDECAYSSKKIYLDAVKRGVTGWPVHIICNSEPSIESVTEALTNGPYGRCAYECDNDVCDNQVVNMEFEGGRTASFTMIAFSEEVCVRKTRIYGTLGEVSCDGHSIRVVDFRHPEKPETFTPESVFTRSKMAGHGGGDWYLMDSFVAAVAFQDPSLILSGPKETLESHLLVFAAEKARRNNSVEETREIASKYLA